MSSDALTALLRRGEQTRISGPERESRHPHDAGDISGKFSKVHTLGDIFSDNWNGSVPADLTDGPDPEATQGVYVDVSAGVVQIGGAIYAEDFYLTDVDADTVFRPSVAYGRLDFTSSGNVAYTGTGLHLVTFERFQTVGLANYLLYAIQPANGTDVPPEGHMLTLQAQAGWDPPAIGSQSELRIYKNDTDVIARQTVPPPGAAAGQSTVNVGCMIPYSDGDYYDVYMWTDEPGSHGLRRADSWFAVKG